MPPWVGRTRTEALEPKSSWRWDESRVLPAKRGSWHRWSPTFLQRATETGLEELIHCFQYSWEMKMEGLTTDSHTWTIQVMNLLTLLMR